MDPVDLSRLDALAEWMRAHGATRVVVDGARLEVDLGAAPATEGEAVTAPTAADLEEAAKKAVQAYDDTLFGRNLR